MPKYISHSENETKQIAKEFAKMVRQTHHKNNVFVLTGELGAGKTIFAQGFAEGLGITDKIISPTFVLIRQHKIPSTTKVFYHIDLYRLENTTALTELGLEEIWSNPNNIVLIEWAEKLKTLPKNTVRIILIKENENTRLITVS